MTFENMKELAGKIRETFGEEAEEDFWVLVDEESDRKVRKEVNTKINATVASLMRHNLDRDAIKQILSEIWFLDEKETRRLIRREEIVNIPVRKLVDYLLSENYTQKEAKAFLEDYAVRVRLASDPSMAALSPEDLSDRLQGVAESEEHQQ